MRHCFLQQSSLSALTITGYNTRVYFFDNPHRYDSEEDLASHLARSGTDAKWVALCVFCLCNNYFNFFIESVVRVFCRKWSNFIVASCDGCVVLAWDLCYFVKKILPLYNCLMSLRFTFLLPVVFSQVLRCPSVPLLAGHSCNQPPSINTARALGQAHVYQPCPGASTPNPPLQWSEKKQFAPSEALPLLARLPKPTVVSALYFQFFSVFSIVIDRFGDRPSPLSSGFQSVELLTTLPDVWPALSKISSVLESKCAWFLHTTYDISQKMLQGNAVRGRKNGKSC